MASELSPQGIRDIRFREKLRGYHPEDVDTFVANVAATVESLHRRINELTAEAMEAPPVAAATDEGSEPSDVEESLRRTLILAQRTADMAVKEAQEEAQRLLAEAQAERDSIQTEADTLRARTMSELENELSSYRQRLHDERDALQRDVVALQTYVTQERERLRIYFAEQLRRVEAGEPVIDEPPATEGPEQPTTVVADTPGLPEQEVAAGEADAVGAPPEGDADASAADVDSVTEPEATDGNSDDPFLAELRRAVSDNEPLGPRDDEPNPELPPRDERDFDIFNQEDGGGRFLRRRR